VAVVLLLLTAVAGFAQKVDEVPEDTIPAGRPVNDSDSIFAISSDAEILKETATVDSLSADTLSNDSLQKQLNALVDENPPLKVKKDWGTWKPDPKRALWLAIVFPGGGQIYNRKYWKLPLIYGGFIGCLYAMNWNDSMYKDYSQAFLDISDNDPGTASYNSFLHLGAKIDENNKERYKEIFKSRKNKYRRWRDLSFFVMVGVYALSVIDAYVDAELSVFDISKDLSLKVEPTILNNSSSNNPFQSGALGLNCSLNF
jgi:hypothetical protein